MNKKKAQKVKLEKSEEVKKAEIADFITEQKTYRRSFLETTYKKHEMDEMKLQIESGIIKVLWHGMEMPEKIAKAFYNLLVYNFREYAKDTENLKQRLLKKGMTTDDLILLIEEDKYKVEINENI
jgi:hypothetical protein